MSACPSSSIVALEMIYGAVDLEFPHQFGFLSGWFGGMHQAH